MKFDLPNIDIFICPALLAAPSSEIRKSEYKEDGLSVDVKLPVKHLITRELQVYTLCGVSIVYAIPCFCTSLKDLYFLQLYYEKITDLTLNKSGSIPFRRALVSLATDSGLHPLVPYFTCFVADEVLTSLSVMFLIKVLNSVCEIEHKRSLLSFFSCHIRWHVIYII